MRGKAEGDWQENYIPEPNSGCWIWLGQLARGYGIRSIKGRRYRMHRMFYELHVAPIPDGMVACHRCDNKMCCNPDHVFIGTQIDNVRDRHQKGRNADLSGEKGPGAKLTQEQVAAICAAPYKHGLYAALARQYSVSLSAISKVRHGRTWKHARNQIH